MAGSTYIQSRGRFRLTPDDRRAIERLLKRLALSKQAAAVRKAIECAALLVKLRHRGKIIASDAQQETREKVDLEPEQVDFADEPRTDARIDKSSGTLEIRLTHDDVRNLSELEEAQFARNRTQIVRRSIHLLTWLLEKYDRGWSFGQVDTSDVVDDLPQRLFESICPPKELAQTPGLLSLAAQDTDSDILTASMEGRPFCEVDGNKIRFGLPKNQAPFCIVRIDIFDSFGAEPVMSVLAHADVETLYGLREGSVIVDEADLVKCERVKPSVMGANMKTIRDGKFDLDDLKKYQDSKTQDMKDEVRYKVESLTELIAGMNSEE